MAGSSGTASIAVSLVASGQILAAVPTKRIRVWSLSLISLISTAVKLQSAANDITGPMNFAITGGIVMPAGTYPWCYTNVGEALNLNMSVNTTVGGVLVYDVV